MTAQQKRIILQNIETLSLDQIIGIVKSGNITLDEFIAAGLNQAFVAQIKSSLITEEERARIEQEKNEFINNIKNGKVNAELIKKHINDGGLTFDELSNMGLSNKLINWGSWFWKIYNALRYFKCSQ